MSAITLNTNFNPITAAPLDARSKFATKAAALAGLSAVQRWVGQPVWIEDEAKEYRFVGGVEDIHFVVAQTNSGTGNANLEFITPAQLTDIEADPTLAEEDKIYVAVGAASGTQPPNTGTDDYEQLTHLPKINGVTLIGDKTSADLNIIEENTGAVQLDTDAQTYQSLDNANQPTGTAQPYDYLLDLGSTQVSGTTNYNDLINRPYINAVQLVGNKTPFELNLVEEAPYDGKEYARKRTMQGVAGQWVESDRGYRNQRVQVLTVSPAGGVVCKIAPKFDEFDVAFVEVPSGGGYDILTIDPIVSNWSGIRSIVIVCASGNGNTDVGLIVTGNSAVIHMNIGENIAEVPIGQSVTLTFARQNQSSLLRFGTSYENIWDYEVISELTAADNSMPDTAAVKALRLLAVEDAFGSGVVISNARLTSEQATILADEQLLRTDYDNHVIVYNNKVNDLENQKQDKLTGAAIAAGTGKLAVFNNAGTTVSSNVEIETSAGLLSASDTQVPTSQTVLNAISSALSGAGGTYQGHFTYLGIKTAIEALTSVTGDSAIAYDGTENNVTHTYRGDFNGTTWTWNELQNAGQPVNPNNADWIRVDFLLPANKSAQCIFQTAAYSSLGVDSWSVIYDTAAAPDNVTIDYSSSNLLEVKPEWITNNVTNPVTALQTGKMDKIQSAVADDIATLNASGQAVDSGVKVVTTFASPAVNTNVPTEKLVKDTIDALTSELNTHIAASQANILYLDLLYIPGGETTNLESVFVRSGSYPIKRSYLKGMDYQPISSSVAIVGKVITVLKGTSDIPGIALVQSVLTSDTISVFYRKYADLLEVTPDEFAALDPTSVEENVLVTVMQD